MRRLSQAVLLVALAAVFLALVSPYIPTPTALSQGKQAQAAVSLVLIGGAIALLLRAASRRPAAFFSGADARASHASVIDLTCNRLC